MAAMRDILLISDLDSVLCQTAPRALRWVWDRFGVVVPPSAIRRYDMEYAVAEVMAAVDLGRSPEEIDAELSTCCWQNPQFYRGLEPRHEIWAALHGWQRRGLPLQFMTRRSEFLRPTTLSWLLEHGLVANGSGALSPWPQLILEAEKAERTAEVCAHYRRVIFLEDALVHAEAIAAASSAEVWLVQQPWNEDPVHERVERLCDSEISRRLAALGAELTS